MQTKSLQTKRALRTALLVLLLGVAGMGKAQPIHIINPVVGDLRYNIVSVDDRTAVVIEHKNGTSATGFLEIPSTVVLSYEVWDVNQGHYEGYTDEFSVTRIGYNAFKDCNGLTGILDIPSSVTEIGQEAFSGCNGFTGVLIISSSVTSLGRGAFKDCSGFSEVICNTTILSDYWQDDSPFLGCRGSVTIGDEVERIPAYMFYGCGGFNGRLTIGKSVASIGKLAFGNCSGFTEIVYNATNCADVGMYDQPFGYGSGSLIIGNEVERIPKYMFYGCRDFNGNLTIGHLLTEIPQEAFYACSGFTGDLIIPNSVIIIGLSAFYGCSGFNGTLVVPSSVTAIGGQAFSGCSGFAEVRYNLTNPTNAYNPSIDSFGCFPDCGGRLVIGANVERIPGKMFSNANFTGDLIIPNSVREIGDEAFSTCGFNGRLELSNSITKIGVRVFEYCRNFSGTLAIPNSVTEIGHSAFYECGFTGSLIIPNSVTKIGRYAFFMCSGFNGNLIIENPQIEIDEAAFCNCCGLTGTLTIPNSWTSISERLFEGCGFTGELVIPNSVTSIGVRAFEDCSGFTGELVIPSSVTEIGRDAFAGCSGFTGELVIPNSVTKINHSTFGDCSGFTGLTIPNSVTFIGGEAFAGCSGFTGGLVLGNSIDTIGRFAFYNCRGFIGDLVIPASVGYIGTCAFLGCDGFDKCAVLGDTPPYLKVEDGFGSFDESLTYLIVPCGRKAVYEASDWADYFTTIEENCGTHTISIGNISFHGGSVIVSDTIAEVGEEVQITVTPDDGMTIDSILVYNPDNPSVVVQLYQIGKGSSIYAFLMPSFDVEIKVMFKPGSAVGENSGIEVSVYPNPTKGLMKIEAEGIKSVCINNMLGQVIYEGKANGNVFEYDFSKHEAGVYLVRIETARGVITKKVTVTK